MKKLINIFWFRRDLRIDDNAGFCQALKSGYPVLPIFIFDSDILNKLRPDDKRVSAIYAEVIRLKKELEEAGSSLEVHFKKPFHVFQELADKYSIRVVHTNHDYEPYAITRDKQVKELLEGRGIAFKTYKDHVIFEKKEIVNESGSVYKVFTPYSKKWKTKFKSEQICEFNCSSLLPNLLQFKSISVPSLEEMGFKGAIALIPQRKLDKDVIKNYHINREYPFLNGTSKLGFHLRFGTISIRNLVKLAWELNHKFLDELIWREFYSMIIWNFPYVTQHAFNKKYEFIPWVNNEEHFERWKAGKTGVPIVDAGMRQLNETGYMHNRVRMIVASFLTKNLLIDWRWGEAYFAERLLDFELASNNGGWQWAAGSGVDAAPYFRVFNPVSQANKFDPNGEYVKTWIPELKDKSYPAPMIDLKKTRQRAINIFKNIHMDNKLVY